MEPPRSEPLVLEPLPHSKVHLFGECYFEGLEREDWGGVAVENISVGSGSCSDLISLLESGGVREQGVFFVGGSVHDRHGWRNGRTLQRLLGWFDTLLHDSVLVLCLVGPHNPREEHLAHNTAWYNAEKKAACDGRRILPLDCTFDSSDPALTDDGIHLRPAARGWMAARMRGLLAGLDARRRVVKVGRDVGRILLGSGYLSVTLLHGHNGGFLSVSNNERVVRMFAPPGHETSSQPGVVRYMKGRRLIVDRISNVLPGELRFSEETYVDSVLLGDRVPV